MQLIVIVLKAYQMQTEGSSLAKNNLNTEQ